MIINLILFFVCITLWLKSRDAKEKLKELEEKVLRLSTELTTDEKLIKNLADHAEVVEKELIEEREKNRKVLSQKKSSEVKLGNYYEQIAPFMNGCPYEPDTLHFLGRPIDMISFDFDQGEITFIEIKTGKSKTSSRQKIIKNIINQGRVYYAELRLNEKGVKHKRYDNENLVFNSEKNIKEEK